MTWRSIETAPKDGTRILLFYPVFKHQVQFSIAGHWSEDICASRPKPYWSPDGAALYGMATVRVSKPTHWCPLPKPPKGMVLRPPVGALQPRKGGRRAGTDPPSLAPVLEAAVVYRGVVYRGRRHGDCIYEISKITGERDPHGTLGFVDTEGVFLTRSEAAVRARACGQITVDVESLASEDLY